MSATWNTVRVFISSTFRDMHAERDHLVRFVFPKLRQELLQRRIHLVDLDLRWGVTSEQDALSVCREVVDECRPRFLCMLGGRCGWVPPGKARSITADEVHYGVLDRDLKDRGFAYFYLRDPSATAAMVEVAPGEFREPAGSHGAVALAELKTAISEAGLQPFIYRAQWDDQSRRLIGLKEFGDRVYADLKQSIDQEFGLTTGEKPDESTEENAAMEAFIEERVQRFVLGSRQPVWNELRHHAESTGGNGYLCLIGAAGSGKSALLGKFCQDYRAAHPQDLVIPHFVGAGPGSTDVRRTLRRLCHELVTGAALTAEIPEDPEKLRVAFAEIIQQASAQKRVVILLDAISQFDSTTQLAGWWWLPEELPATARIILSTLSGPAFDSLRQRPRPPRSVELQPLDAPDREAIIREFLHRYRKTMTDDQLAALLAKADAGTPLYLLVALEELRTLGTYEEITDRITQLPPDTRALFIWILKRLEDDDGFRDASGRKIGRELVSRFVSLLGASRHGLSQQELVELLSPGDPQGNVAALAQLLRPYLMQRSELLDFHHGQLKHAVGRRYLSGEGERVQAHKTIADYFQIRWREPNKHALAELPHEQVEARMWPELAGTLTDIRFVESKSRAGMVYELLDDYREALYSWPGQEEVRRQQAEQEERIHRYVEGLIAHVGDPDHVPLPEPPPNVINTEAAEPTGPRRGNWTSLEQLEGWNHFAANHTTLLAAADIPVFQLAYNSADSGPVVEAMEQQQCQGSGFRGPWLRLANRPRYTPRPAMLRTLEGHTGAVTAVALSADGTCAVSASNDETLRVWELASGRCVKKLEGHTGSVCAIALSADGRQAISGSSDKTVRVWNVMTGQCLRVMDKQPRGIHGMCITVDAKMGLMTVGDSTNLMLIDLATGMSWWALYGHERTPNAMAFTLDARMAVSGSGCSSQLCRDGKYYSDNTLRVWNLHTRSKCVRVFEGHPGGTTAVALSADGHIALSGGADGALRLWDLTVSEYGNGVPRHTAKVTVVTLSDDCRLAVSGSSDATLRLWDMGTGVPLHTMIGHDAAVHAVALTARGRRAISGAGGEHKRLCIWDLETGACVRAERPSPSFTMALTPDGRRIVWAQGGIDTNNLVEVFDSETVDPIKSIWGHSRLIHAVKLTLDGRLAVSASYDRTLRTWDLANGKCLALHRGHTSDVCDVEIAPDGRIAVSVAYGSCPGDKAIRLWDVVSGKCLRIMEGHSGIPKCLALTKDGRRLVSGGDDKEVRIWDLASGGCTAELHGHTKSVNVVGITQDNQRILSGGMDGLVRVWDLETSECIWMNLQEDTAISSLAVARSRFIVGGWHGSVHVLSIENLRIGPPIVCACRLWLFGPKEVSGRWDDKLTTVCPGCGARFVVGRDILDTITGIAQTARLSPDQSPCLGLPDEAWGERRLFTACPHCHQSLRFNPFVHDFRDSVLP